MSRRWSLLSRHYAATNEPTRMKTGSTDCEGFRCPPLCPKRCHRLMRTWSLPVVVWAWIGISRAAATAAQHHNPFGPAAPDEPVNITMTTNQIVKRDSSSYRREAVYWCCCCCYLAPLASPTTSGTSGARIGATRPTTTAVKQASAWRTWILKTCGKSSGCLQRVNVSLPRCKCMFLPLHVRVSMKCVDVSVKLWWV